MTLVVGIVFLGDCLKSDITEEEVRERIEIVGEVEVEIKEVSGKEVRLKAAADYNLYFKGS